MIKLLPDSKLEEKQTRNSTAGEHEKADRAEQIKGLQDRLSTHRRTLSLLLEQKAVFGVNTAPHIQIGIDKARSEIKSIKQALHDVGEIADDQYGDDGDQSADSTARERESRSLIEEEYVEKTAAVYIEPVTKAYDDAKWLLDQKHVVVLCGSAEMGTRMTGVHLLRSHHSDKMYQWDPRTEISLLRTTATEESLAHLIDQMQIDAHTLLDKYELQRLSSQLKDHQSYLVITIKEAPSIIREQLADYIVIWDSAPEDRNLLLEKHLLWHLRNSEDTSKVYDLCYRPEIQSLIRKSSPGKIDDLAHELALAIDDEAQIQVVLENFKRNAAEQIATWFAANTDLQHCAFLVALAVLNGAKAPSIIEAAQDFLLRIKPPLREGDTPEPSALFNRPRQRWVEICRARVVGDHEQTAFGKSRIERIELNDPDFAWEVIEYVWREHSHFHWPMLDWLREMLENTDASIRKQAASAIGKLSIIDFDEVYAIVIRPYAQEYKPDRWQSIENMLNILLLDDLYAAHALQLLHQWSTSEKPWALPWTAAIIYGQFAGLFYPEQALADLRSIVLKNDTGLTEAVYTSIFNLFYFSRQYDTPYECILNALDEWTSNKKDAGLMSTGLLIFLNITEDEVILNDSQDWPTLLWLQYSHPAHHERIIRLWRRALNGEASRDLGLQMLSQWLQLADDHTYIYPAVEQLVGELIQGGTAREQERLYFHLRKWAVRYKRKVRAAEKILAAIG